MLIMPHMLLNLLICFVELHFLACIQYKNIFLGTIALPYLLLSVLPALLNLLCR